MIGLMAVWASARRFFPIAACAIIGLLIGLCSHFAHRASANAQAMRDQAHQFVQAQALAAQAAQAERDREEADYRAKAMEAENAYQSQLDNARGALGRYIADHRLQPAPHASGPGATVAGPNLGSSGLSEGMPSGAVVVSPADLQACTDTVTYAVKAHDWAVALDQQKSGDPAG